MPAHKNGGRNSVGYTRLECPLTECHTLHAPLPELDSAVTALVGHRESLPEELPHFFPLLVTAQVQVLLPRLLAAELIPNSTQFLHFLYRAKGRLDASELHYNKLSINCAAFKYTELYVFAICL